MTDSLAVAFSVALAAAAQLSSPKDLFTAAALTAGSNCGNVGSSSISDAYHGYNVADCMRDLSETSLYAEGGAQPGEAITIYIVDPLPKGSALDRDLAHSLTLHAPNGTIGSHPVKLLRTKISALGKRMMDCYDRLEPGHFEISVPDLVPKTAACVKAIPELKIREFRFDGKRIKVRSGADAATIESLRGAVNSVEEGQVGLALYFVDVTP